jgi:hypothetical protein
MSLLTIKCDEAEDGGFVVTQEVLVEWNKWLMSNCKEEVEKNK